MPRTIRWIGGVVKAARGDRAALVKNVLLFVALTVQASKAFAQVPPLDRASATNSKGDRVDGIVILSSIAQKNKVAFIAEGKPSFTTKSSELRSFQAELSRQPILSDKNVAQVAEYLDYSMARRGNILLLRKWYSDAEELPDITMSECFLSLQNVVKSYSLFINLPNGKATDARDFAKERLLDSFTPRQWKQMALPSGLSVGQLSAAQPNLLNGYNIASHYMYDLYSIQRSQAELLDVNRKEAALTFVDGKRYMPDLEGKMVFGYTFPAEANNHFFIPLSHPHQLIVQPIGIAKISTKQSPISNTASVIGIEKRLLEQIQRPDPTTPTEADKKPEPPPSPDTKTIGEIIEQLNKKEGSPNPARYQVHEAYAAKTVTIIGGENLTPEETLRAIADIYGMRLVHTNEGLALRPPALRLARNLAELPGTVAEIVPPPLRRAWSPKPSGKTFMVAQDDFKARQLRAQNRQETLYAAVRRLRVLAEPKIKAAKDHKVLLSDLGPDADRALANVLMIRAAPSLMALMDANLPDYMLHPENIVLTGSYTVQDDGKKKASLFINVKNADGTLSQRAGFF